MADDPVATAARRRENERGGFDPSRSVVAGLGVLAGSALLVLAVVLIVQAIVR